jgi:hypothetical protein
MTKDSRQVYYVHELPEDVLQTLLNATYDHLDPELDALLEDAPVDLEALYNEHKDSGTYESLFEGKSKYERG